MIFGAHCSTAGGLDQALERGKRIGADVVQLFVKNNMQWLGKELGESDRLRFLETRQRLGMGAVFGHTGYLINLGAASSANRDRSLASLIQEIKLATAIGLPFLVLHPGAHLGAGEADGLRQVVAGLDEVLGATRDSPVRIALENTAGQGTCLGARIEHLASIYDGVQRPERLGLCLDTAHFFAAGYDLRKRQVWDTTMQEVANLVGLDQILAFHLNDSKTELGSRVDRHAGIGEGCLGREAFGWVVNDPRFVELPGCLETPKSEDLHEDMHNLAILRSLVTRGKRPRPTIRAAARRRAPHRDERDRARGSARG